MKQHFWFKMMLNITADFWPYNPVKACHLYQKSLKCQPASQTCCCFFSSSFLLPARTDAVLYGKSQELRKKVDLLSCFWLYVLLEKSALPIFALQRILLTTLVHFSKFQPWQLNILSQTFMNIFSSSRFWIYVIENKKK